MLQAVLSVLSHCSCKAPQARLCMLWYVPSLLAAAVDVACAFM